MMACLGTLKVCPTEKYFLYSCLWSFPKEYQISNPNLQFRLETEAIFKGNYPLDWKGSKEYFTKG